MKKEVKNIFEHTDCVSEEMLMKYISGKLSPAEKHEVEKHLIDCEMCSDAVEGLSMMDGKRISLITSELKKKVQNKAEKKEVKVIFLRQYRTQLAVAASIVLVLGLVWFFKANFSMKEMDNAEAEKMFADKFVPPPAEKDEESFDSISMPAGQEQSEPGSKNPIAVAHEPLRSVKDITIEDAEKKALVEEAPSYSESEGVKPGKDMADEKHLAENIKQEDIPVQKAGQLRKGIVVKKSEEKEDFYWENSNAEAPKANVSTESKLKTRDEDNGKDEIAKVTMAKGEHEKNQNELESLKEKDKKTDESKKAQPTTISNTEATTASTPESVDNIIALGASSVSSNASVQDKSALAKQDVKKPSDDRERTDANTVNRGQKGEGDVLAYETETKSGGKGKKAKEEQPNAKFKKAPQKISAGYVNTQTIASGPVPEIQSETKTTQTEPMAGEANGTVMMDSVSANVTTFGTTVLADGQMVKDSAMVKYDKQDYAGAAYDFEKALKQNPNDEKALFYSAVSYLSLGQTEKALTNFTKILSNKNSKYYDGAQWYSSLAYIKNNDLKNARTNLMQIQQNQNSRYKKQADETLEQIKK